MEFKVNRFLSLKLEGNKTIIYINKEPFILCKGLFVDMPIRENHLEINGSLIDNLAERSEQTLKHHLSPEVEFWAHSSNLQVWVENSYNTVLLHSNISFPILRRLTEVGDLIAKRVFKDEIGKRFSSGYLPVVKYLMEESYISYLNEEEQDNILEELRSNLINNKPIEQNLSVLEYLFKNHFPKAKETMKDLIMREFKKGDVSFSKFMFEKDYFHYLDRLELYNCLNSKDILIKIGHYVRGELELHAEFNSGERPGFNIEGNKVTGLDLWGCRLETFPKEILELKYLKDLKLNSNLLQSLPEDLKNLILLKNLFLEDNNLRTLPAAFGYLPSLETVNLDCNSLSSLPDSMGNLKKLKRLSLISNNLSELPESISSLESLVFLNLGSNDLKDLPESFEKLENLQVLSLENNQFSTFPDVLTKLKSLKKLHIGANCLSTIPESIGNFDALTELILSSNKFTSLPESIGDLKSLKTLIISWSNLESLPESIGNLESLEKLYLSQHNIKAFPKSIIYLPSLKELDVRSLKKNCFSEVSRSLRELEERKVRIYK